MDSAAFLTALADGLRPKVAAAGGVLDVASDPDEVIDMLAVSPRGWRVILSYGGDEAVDPDEQPGIVRWTLQTTIQAARGLRVQKGADAHMASAEGREALLSLADLTGRWVRGFSGSHPDLHPHGFRHVSKQWLVIEGLATRQIMLTHRATMALDGPIITNCAFS